jgi:sterol 24-C-methyltransferase
MFGGNLQYNRPVVYITVMLEQISTLVLAGAAVYLRNKGLSRASITDAPPDVRVVAGAAAASGVFLGASLIEYVAFESGEGPISRTLSFFATFFGQEGRRKIVVNNWIDEYNALHKADDPNARNSAYAKLVNSYYELATMFYEWGWGSSFHFAYRLPHESFSESIRRHEYYLAGFLRLPPKSKVLVYSFQSLHPRLDPLAKIDQVLDVGCGIGGPYRNIARFTGWDITGITLNQYQAWSTRPSLRATSPDR